MKRNELKLEFRAWLEAACFGGGIVTPSAKCDLTPVEGTLWVGDKVRISRDLDQLWNQSIPGWAAGKTGVVDRVAYGAMVRVKLPDGRHVYVNNYLLTKVGRSAERPIAMGSNGS